MRKINAALCLLSIGLVSVAHARELTSFQEISQAVKAGKQLQFVTQAEHCLPAHGGVIASFRPRAVLLFEGKKIVTSDKYFTMNSHVANGKPVYEYVKYSVNADNTVSISNTVIDAKSLEPIGKPYTMQCVIGEGEVVYSAK